MSATCEPKMVTSSRPRAGGGCATERDLLDLALALEQDPQAEEVRGALLASAQVLLSEGEDEVILRAIGQVAPGKAAQAIRKAAETASERVSMRANGVSLQRALFCVPLIIEFDREVPESHVDSALRERGSPGSLVARLRGCELTAPHARALLQFFKFSDLAPLPLSLIRRAAVRLAMATQGADAEAQPFLANDTPLRRSRIFLRYIVGQRVVFEDEAGSTGERTLCIRLQEAAQELLRRKTAVGCTVDAFYTGAFHEPLYTGMWLYQTRRLEHTTRALREAAGRGAELTAVIAMLAAPLHSGLKLGFYEGEQPIGPHAYLLHARPVEDLERCTNRVSSRIAAQGVKTRTHCLLIRERPPFDIFATKALPPHALAIPV